MEQLTPEIMEAVAKVGSEYITFLYFKHLLLALIVVVCVYGLFKLIKEL